MAHVIEQTREGLQLLVDGAPIALIRERGGCLDLVWQLRGPQALPTARQAIFGLLDLLVHHDALAAKLAAGGSRHEPAAEAP